MRKSATFYDLDGASVFITGGGSGIGAALTEGFLAQGSRVAFVQRSDATAFVEDMAKKYDNKPYFVKCDVTDVSSLQECCRAAAKEHGDVSVLINNAANDDRHTLESADVAYFDNCIATNFRPHFFTAQAVVEGMKAAGGGSIINFSSVSYMMGNAGMPIYASTKSAITGFTRVLARELGPHHIRVNTLAPGWVQTERQQRLWATEEKLSKFLARQCLPVHLYAEDIVGGALFLASNTSAKMTGQVLVIDGGAV